MRKTVPNRGDEKSVVVKSRVRKKSSLNCANVSIMECG